MNVNLDTVMSPSGTNPGHSRDQVLLINRIAETRTHTHTDTHRERHAQTRTHRHT